MYCLKQFKSHILLIIILLIGSTPLLHAQDSSSRDSAENKWFIGINGGVQTFWGDIKFNPFWPNLKTGEFQPGGGFVFGRILIPSLQVSSELNFISLKGQKEFLTDTLGFKTQALSFAIKGQFNPIALLKKRKTKFSIFIESGIGFNAWRSLLQNLNTNDTLNNLGWGNPNKEFGLFVPLGIKFEYQFSPKVSAYFANTYNLVFNDLLDAYITGNQDAYTYSALGINYYFGKQKTTPQLLNYAFYEMAYDSVVAQTAKINKETPKQTTSIEEKINPFTIDIETPEKSPHTGFDINIRIEKFGIPASGYFRLLVPSGFIPQSTPNIAVSFTKLGYNYEYDFILPMNQNITNIPIHINLSEIEKGTYPVLIEGEILDHKNTVFPIKLASYVEIISEAEWYKGLTGKEQEKVEAIETADKQIINKISDANNLAVQKESGRNEQNVSKTTQPKDKDLKKGIYHIQILASRKPYAGIESFKTKHALKEEVFVANGEGWYRYNIYKTNDVKEIYRLLTKVRTEYGINQAFVVYYENGKRILASKAAQSVRSSSPSMAASVKNAIISKQIKFAQKENTSNLLSNKLIYRIEIAIGYDKPIPLYVLQNKVGQESISEFKQKQNYYYTIGEFEDITMTQAYLEFVKTQFKMQGSKIVLYQKDQRIKIVL